MIEAKIKIFLFIIMEFFLIEIIIELLTSLDENIG